MMKWLQNLSNTKINLDIWFFFLFLFTFTLSVRKVLFYFPIQGTFNEYAGTYIYLSDMFLFLAIGSWLVLSLCNEWQSLSMYRLWITSLLHKLSHLSTIIKSTPYLYTPLILVIWAFLSIFWSDNKVIAIFRSVKLLEYYFLYLYVILRFIPKLFHMEQNTPLSLLRRGVGGEVNNVPRGTLFNKKCSTWNIFFIAILSVSFIQSVIAIIQVIIQHSIGMLWLKESIISPVIPGVAKIAINGEKFIRAYGLFPHPNILGGFLLFSIIMTLLYIRMFHVEHRRYVNVPRLPRESKLFHVEHFDFLRDGTFSTGWNNSVFYGVEQFAFLRGGTFVSKIIYILLLIQMLALLLTASKSAIIGLLIALAYTYVPRLPAGRTDGTIYTHLTYLKCSTPACRRGRWNILSRKLILSVLIITVLGFLLSPIIVDNFNNSVEQRLFFYNVPRGTILANPILGVGTGQFVWNMQRYSSVLLETWQYQPVHSVFLLIWSELGIIGLGLFIWFLYIILQNKYNDLSICDTSLIYFKGILLGFLFIMLFDHYFWDIQQGSYLLWITAGLIAGITRK